MEIIEIKDLKKAYGIKSVLKGISISVRKGTIHGFIGPNGAGKTTTIKSLMGAVIPDSGEIYITGKKRDKVEDINKKIGYMFEKLDFSNDLTVEEFIHLVGRERDISSKNVEEYLQKSELWNFKQKKCSELSTGWSKILFYFVAVIHNPDILVLDEPTSGLDPSHQQVLLYQLDKIRQRGGTVLISSHVLSDLQELVDDVTLINGGEIVYTGEKPSNIKKMYEDLIEIKKMDSEDKNLNWI